MPPLLVDLTPNDIATGRAMLGRWAADLRASDPRDAWLGLFELLANAERTRLMASITAGQFPDPSTILTLEVGARKAEAIETLGGPFSNLYAAGSVAGHPEPEARQRAAAIGYLAALNAARALYYSARSVTKEPIAVLPTIPGIAPAVLVAVTVVGVAAVAGASWFGVEAVRANVEVERYAAQAAAEVELYLRDLQARIAAGQPLPDPPKGITSAAMAEKSLGLGGLAIGAVLGATALAGAFFYMRGKRASGETVSVSNPRRRRARVVRRIAARRRRNPPALPAPKRKRTAKRSNPKRGRKRRNPLARGYSRATVGGNIAKMRREGMPAGQASAAALRSARASWRRAHPKGAFPAHLKPKAKRNPKRKAITARKRKPVRHPGHMRAAKDLYALSKELRREGHPKEAAKIKARADALYKKKNPKRPKPAKRAATKRTNPKRRASRAMSKRAFVAKLPARLTPKQKAGLWKGYKARAGKKVRRR